MFYFSGLQLHFYNWFGTNVHERNKGVGGPGEPIPSLISRWGSEHLWTPNFFMRIQAFFQKGKVLKKNSVLWNVKLFIYIFKLCVRQKTVFSLECSETHYDIFFLLFWTYIYIYIFKYIYWYSESGHHHHFQNVCHALVPNRIPFVTKSIRKVWLQSKFWFYTTYKIQIFCGRGTEDSQSFNAFN